MGVGVGLAIVAVAALFVLRPPKAPPSSPGGQPAQNPAPAPPPQRDRTLDDVERGIAIGLGAAKAASDIARSWV